MTEEKRIQDLSVYGKARLPVVLVLDTSGSMLVTTEGTPVGREILLDGKRYRAVMGGQTRLDRLVQGVKDFLETVYEDEYARQAADIAMVSCVDGGRLLVPFFGVPAEGAIPALQPTVGERTTLGAGLLLALSLLEEREASYRQAGVPYFHPWLVIASDGEDRGEPADLTLALRRLEARLAEETLTVFALSPDGSPENLSVLLPAVRPVSVEKNRIREQFRFLPALDQAEATGEPDPYARPEDAFIVESWEQAL